MSYSHEVACAAITVPAALAEVAGYSWRRNTIGESGGAVYRLTGKPGAPDFYLKHGSAADVGDEAERLRWFAGRIAVPEVRGFARSGSEAWLLTAAIPGPTAYQALTTPGNHGGLVDAITDFLIGLHSLPAATCPFASDHRCRLADARRRLDAGLADTDDFDAARRGWTAAAVWMEMTALLPLAPDAVVTHGDFSLDNLIIGEGGVVACIDVGRAGVADRYQDLSILWRSLADFAPALTARMLARYGVGAGDERKLKFHLLLDEFF